MDVTEEQFELLSTLLASFLMSERERYYQVALAIPEEQQSALKSFFRPELLEFTRIHLRNGEPLQNPDFYPMLAQMGIGNLPDLAAVEAITFQDVIVFVSPLTDKLLFHELVHAEQVRQLGTGGFARSYVKGFLAAGTYEAIPLEIQAYGLEAQYAADPRRPFSVEEEVARWTTEGRFS